jgi:hypothetical protein
MTRLLMRRARHPFILLLLFAVYSLIALSPLAPLALKSPRLAHAITGECSGDCEICGCAPERRASRTCCCWKKKLREKRMAARRTAGSPGPGHGCCHKRMRYGPDAEAGERDAGSSVELRCTPCGGSGKAASAASGEQHHIPCRFVADISLPSCSQFAVHRVHFPKLPPHKPPVPPPEILLTA